MATATVTRLEYSLEHVHSPQDLRDARTRALDALESTIQSHLDAGLIVREVWNNWHTDWTREGSAHTTFAGSEVTRHLLARFQGFGTTLQFLPDDRPRCGDPIAPNIV